MTALPNGHYKLPNGHCRRLLGTYKGRTTDKVFAVYEAIEPRRPSLGSDEHHLPQPFRAMANGYLHSCELHTFTLWTNKAGRTPMTLDEAIQHAESKKHVRMSAWLKELRGYREEDARLGGTRPLDE